jgi:hypothetical protein
MKEKIQNKFMLFTQNISTKYLSQRVSPELFKETRFVIKLWESLNIHTCRKTKLKPHWTVPLNKKKKRKIIKNPLSFFYYLTSGQLYHFSQMQTDATILLTLFHKGSILIN